MRRDDHALQLLFGDIGKREHGPVALVIVGTGAHLDAPADAVRTRRGGNLKGFALIGIDIRGGGEIERRVVTGDLDRLEGEGMGGKTAQPARLPPDVS